MDTLPRALMWNRLDTTGTDVVFIDDRRGLAARGTATAATPVPYTCRYDLTTEDSGASERLDVQTEGAGWRRQVKLERTIRQWRVTASEQGDLSNALTHAGHAPVGLAGAENPDLFTDAVDVELACAPLFATLPIRRLGLLKEQSRNGHRVTVAWILVPSLEVVAAGRIYSRVDHSTVQLSMEGFTTQLTIDDGGYVTHYPGLVTRVP
ncbi:MAG: putative glycolipid-binding domain-containing protein [Longispora sp.]|nr:putative glycolipid-binding domain-containing protein [Longispora sp. (in: high G+C Gram-positive bacteria)]